MFGRLLITRSRCALSAWPIFPPRLQPADETESKLEPGLERSAIGAILPVGSESDASDVFVRAGFQLARLPRVTDSLVSTFPHVSFLSVAIGSRRLFSCMTNYVKVSPFDGFGVGIILKWGHIFICLSSIGYVHVVAMLSSELRILSVSVDVAGWSVQHSSQSSRAHWTVSLLNTS